MRRNAVMSKPLLVIAVAAVATVTITGSARIAAAQELTETPRRRQGYYFAAGYGLGQTQARHEDENLGVWPSGKLALRAGQLLTKRFGLGLLIDTSAATEGPTTRGVLGIAIEGQATLVGNLALRTSVGFGALQINDKMGDKQVLRGGAYGSQFGLGISYDWFPWTSNRSGGHANAGGALVARQQGGQFRRLCGCRADLLDRSATQPAAAARIRVVPLARSLLGGHPARDAGYNSRSSAASTDAT